MAMAAQFSVLSPACRRLGTDMGCLSSPGVRFFMRLPEALLCVAVFGAAQFFDKGRDYWGDSGGGISEGARLFLKWRKINSAASAMVVNKPIRNEMKAFS